MSTRYRAAGISLSEDEFDDNSLQPSSYRRMIPKLNKKSKVQSLLPSLSNRTELYIPSALKRFQQHLMFCFRKKLIINLFSGTLKSNRLANHKLTTAELKRFLEYKINILIDTRKSLKTLLIIAGPSYRLPPYQLELVCNSFIARYKHLRENNGFMGYVSH